MSAQRFPDAYLLSGVRHEATFARQHPDTLPAELTVLRINDIALAVQIKAGSPVAHTFVLSVANGSVGYLPTREAAEAVLGLSLRDFTDPVKNRRHYGATITTEVGPAAGEMVVAETLRLLVSVGEHPATGSLRKRRSTGNA